jgi:CRP-like cAMP-binding protein
LQSCEFRGVGSGEAICQVNGQSNEMYILLSGQLGVYNERQMLLASIDPVAPVGEMGLITGQPRSATVSALSDSNLLVLRKVAFDRLMRSNSQLCLQVYRSVISTLHRRLGESRVERARAVNRRSTLEEKLDEIEEQVFAMNNGGGGG